MLSAYINYWRCCITKFIYKIKSNKHCHIRLPSLKSQIHRLNIQFLTLKKTCFIRPETHFESKIFTLFCVCTLNILLFHNHTAYELAFTLSFKGTVSLWEAPPLPSEVEHLQQSHMEAESLGFGKSEELGPQHYLAVKEEEKIFLVNELMKKENACKRRGQLDLQRGGVLG